MSAITRYVCALVALTVVSLLAGPVEAQLTRDPEVEAAYAAGVAAFESEDWEAAVVAFSNAVADETYAEAYLGLGDSLRELEDYSSALNAYRQAVTINPKMARGFLGRGIASRELGQLQLAHNDFDTASELDRNDPEIAANYGDLLVNIAQDSARAIRYLDKAIELDPTDSKSFRNRGWAHTMLQQFDEAVNDLEKSIELAPDDYETHARLATVHLFQEDYTPGIDALSKAIDSYVPEESTDPKIYLQGYIQRGSAELLLGNQEETSEADRNRLMEAVIADSETVLNEFPDRFPESGIALFRKGLALRMQEKFGEAIIALNAAIRLVPAGTASQYGADAYLKRGICWHYQGQEGLARGDFEQAATIAFEDPRPHLWIGYTYSQEGEYRKAIESFGDAISKNASFPLPYVNRGLAYIQLGDYEKAVDNFNEAIRSEPNEANHFHKRGVAYLLLEDPLRAFDSFEHALLRDKEHDQARRGASRALQALERSGLADEYLKRAEELDLNEQ